MHCIHMVLADPTCERCGVLKVDSRMLVHLCDAHT
jgi:hypothetical protein